MGDTKGYFNLPCIGLSPFYVFEKFHSLSNKVVRQLNLSSLDRDVAASLFLDYYSGVKLNLTYLYCIYFYKNSSWNISKNHIIFTYWYHLEFISICIHLYIYSQNEVLPTELTKLSPRALDQLIKILVQGMRNALSNCWSVESKILPTGYCYCPCSPLRG